MAETGNSILAGISKCRVIASARPIPGAYHDIDARQTPTDLHIRVLLLVFTGLSTADLRHIGLLRTQVDHSIPALRSKGHILNRNPGTFCRTRRGVRSEIFKPMLRWVEGQHLQSASMHGDWLRQR